MLVDGKELKGKALAEYVEKTYGYRHVQRKGHDVGSARVGEEARPAVSFRLGLISDLR